MESLKERPISERSGDVVHLNLPKRRRTRRRHEKVASTAVKHSEGKLNAKLLPQRLEEFDLLQCLSFTPILIGAWEEQVVLSSRVYSFYAHIFLSLPLVS